MDAWLSPAFGVKSANPRRLIYGLLFAFNALLWLLLIAFQWEVSLRAREAHYFGQQLFPLRAQRVPMPVIYAAFTLLTLASLGAVYRDRSNLRIRERIGTLMFQILESLEIGVVVLDRAGVLTMANESARRLLPEIPPAGAGLRILKVLENRTELKRIAQSAVEEGNYVREVEHNLGTSENAFPVRVTTLPLKDRHKRVSGALVLIHDVREVVDMERQLRTAERLSALGTLAAALAHEIRNPLEALSLNLELLQRSLDPSPDPVPPPKSGARYLQILQDEVVRLAGTVQNFLSFARPTSVNPGRIEVDRILEQVADLLENQARCRGIEIDVVLPTRPIPVGGSEDQLKQAFLNLTINSIEAMPHGGRLSLRAEIAGQTSADSQNPSVIVSIRDTGEGIPQDRISRLFDPYYSTKPTGTGLGLTVVHRVIQEHRGRIRVDSTPGRGATFTVELPLLEAGR